MTVRGQLQSLAVAIVSIVLLSILIFFEPASPQTLFVPGLVAMLAAVLLASAVGRGISSSISDMTHAARTLGAGDLSARPPISASGELGELGAALGRLADQLASRIGAFRNEEAVLTGVVEALDEGVITLDSTQRVTRVNAAARSILGITATPPFAAELLPRSPELRLALEAAARGEQIEPLETTLGGRSLSIVARPLRAGGGIVLALFDLTRIKRLETVRRDFVANVSHELRTPLTVITGFAETLDEDDVPPDMRRQFASAIRTHAERMRRIVDDLLDISRLESGRWTPQSAAVDIRETGEEIAATYRPAATSRNLRIAVDVDDAASQVEADPTAIRQILSNLVDNSIRHTESGDVTIYSSREAGGVRIGVRDTGVGIAPAHVSRIFERFYRADPGRSRESGGTGLGLAIVKHLVDAHGGSVQVESELGKGTTISALFPAE